MKCYDFFSPQAFNFILLLCFSMSSAYLNCCLCRPESILRHCEVPLPSLSSGSAPVAAERVCVGSCLCRLAQCSQRPVQAAPWLLFLCSGQGFPQGSFPQGLPGVFLSQRDVELMGSVLGQNPSLYLLLSFLLPWRISHRQMTWEAMTAVRGLEPATCFTPLPA